MGGALSATEASADQRARIVAIARSWIGTPYRHQGRLKGVGCDCLGLLIGVFEELTGERIGALPPYTPDWAEASGRETLAEGLRGYMTEIDPAAAREGDIVLFRWRAHLPAKHAGILVTLDRMVHAQEKARVAEVALGGWWGRRMAYVFDFSAPLDPYPYSARRFLAFLISSIPNRGCHLEFSTIMASTVRSRRLRS